MVYTTYALILSDRFFMHFLIRVPMFLCLYTVNIMRRYHLDPSSIGMGIIVPPIATLIPEFVGYLNFKTQVKLLINLRRIELQQKQF